MKRLLPLLPLIVPPAARWAAWQERKILREGTPLGGQALEDAVRMGVRHPERIRVLEVERIPLLNAKPLDFASRFFPEVTSHTIGLSLRYGIYLRRQHSGNRRLLAHECVHTAQYERLGGIEEFLEVYLRQCLESGYPQAPLEREAVRRSSEL